MKNLIKSCLLLAILMFSGSLVKSQSLDKVWEQAKTLYDNEDYQSAFPLMLKAAQKNHLQAQHHLGAMYGLGRGIEIDYSEAVKWYKKSAEQGYHWGEFSMGVMYRDGLGVKRDYSLAIRYFRKAVEQNNEAAFGGLGYMLENGEGCTKNFREAINLYQKGARLGDKWTQNRLTQLGYSW